jgi:HSP20 family protein
MLMRFDPFRDIDRLASQLVGEPAAPMDVYREGDRFVVNVDLPGVDPGSIDVTVEKNVLTIRAERSWKPTENQEVVVNERRQGTFTRRLFLGEGLDTDRIEARYTNGVLTVTVPLAERAKARRIAVTAAGAPVEVSATEARGS